MRYAFIQELTKQAEKNSDIMLLTADLGFTVFENFQQKFPKQFINVGVSESNMIGMAAGLAMSGKIVFAYSIATFVTMRPYEYIRLDVGLHNLPVIIVGTGAGLSYSNDGPTHHATEDIALMRSIPNMTVLAPADPIEARWAVHAAIVQKKPMYLRLGKRGEPSLYPSEPILKIGKGSILREGNDVAIIATGNIVANALSAADLLKKNGKEATVVSLHTIAPLDTAFIKKLAKQFSLIVTVEEHSLSGGLGGAVAEVVAQIRGNRAKVEMLGIPKVFTYNNGTQEYLRNDFGLTASQIAEHIQEIIHD